MIAIRHSASGPSTSPAHTRCCGLFGSQVDITYIGRDYPTVRLASLKSCPLDARDLLDPARQISAAPLTCALPELPAPHACTLALDDDRHSGTLRNNLPRSHKKKGQRGIGIGWHGGRTRFESFDFREAATAYVTASVVDRVTDEWLFACHIKSASGHYHELPPSTCFLSLHKDILRVTAAMHWDVDVVVPKDLPERLKERIGVRHG